MIKIGLIGCGAISKIHINAIREIPYAKISAVSDMNEDTAKKTAQETGCEYYTDYKDLISNSDIDMVDICTPSGMRKDIVIYAANNKKHILTEKPIEITKERIDEMLKACYENNVFISAIFNRRYNETYVFIKNAIENGRLGRLILGDVIMKWYRPKEYYAGSAWRGTWTVDGGGALMNQCIHFIDMLQWLMGPVHSVFATTEKLVHTYMETEDTAAGILKFKNDAIGIIEAATSLYPGFSSRISVHGTDGGIIVENDQIVELKLKNPLPEDALIIKENNADRSSSALTNIKNDYDLHKKQIAEYINAVREGTPPKISGEEAGKAVEIITAMYKASSENKPVQISI
jgi:UDP-N-acetyl-2-amino-2-deoxyglucuronate dehydrogenase